LMGASLPERYDRTVRHRCAERQTQKSQREAGFSDQLNLEARTGVEPVYTALQAAA
jgi:hypothetical protein